MLIANVLLFATPSWIPNDPSSSSAKNSQSLLLSLVFKKILAFPSPGFSKIKSAWISVDDPPCGVSCLRIWIDAWGFVVPKPILPSDVITATLASLKGPNLNVSLVAANNVVVPKPTVPSPTEDTVVPAERMPLVVDWTKYPVSIPVVLIPVIVSVLIATVPAAETATLKVFVEFTCTICNGLLVPIPILSPIKSELAVMVTEPAPPSVKSKLSPVNFNSVICVAVPTSVSPSLTVIPNASVASVIGFHCGTFEVPFHIKTLPSALPVELTYVVVPTSLWYGISPVEPAAILVAVPANCAFVTVPIETVTVLSPTPIVPNVNVSSSTIALLMVSVPIITWLSPTEVTVVPAEMIPSISFRVCPDSIPTVEIPVIVSVVIPTVPSPDTTVSNIEAGLIADVTKSFKKWISANVLPAATLETPIFWPRLFLTLTPSIFWLRSSERSAPSPTNLVALIIPLFWFIVIPVPICTLLLNVVIPDTFNVPSIDNLEFGLVTPKPILPSEVKVVAFESSSNNPKSNVSSSTIASLRVSVPITTWLSPIEVTVVPAERMPLVVDWTVNPVSIPVVLIPVIVSVVIPTVPAVETLELNRLARPICKFCKGFVVPIPIFPPLLTNREVPPVPTSRPRFILKFWSAKVHCPLCLLYFFIFIFTP